MYKLTKFDGALNKIQFNESINVYMCLLLVFGIVFFIYIVVTHILKCIYLDRQLLSDIQTIRFIPRSNYTDFHIYKIYGSRPTSFATLYLSISLY